jgi:hypothetical protein
MSTALELSSYSVRANPDFPRLSNGSPTAVRVAPLPTPTVHAAGQGEAPSFLPVPLPAPVKTITLSLIPRVIAYSSLGSCPDTAQRSCRAC